jgi:hypothetical protein
VLAAWYSRYHHLREVTSEDMLAAIDGLTGLERPHILSVIWSLFRPALPAEHLESFAVR